ncbi:DUF2306 domain-containing protein [Pseudohongiella spirulinae]|uniref:Membrane protein (DUF2306) n=1 Tax=Pseudohongiella spirulinae TaxID=1249552 RepID=A0A0S2KBU7_9GAMM|nr:DUF2306 domain-containing protein [Pseudohongiella spirulinae]ALO45757.1 hypothetical protein PS2015_1095 [Pseudohongiella spirulinae]
MTSISPDKFDNSPAVIASASVKHNWPLVGTLFVLTAIPGIPAILIVLLVLIGPVDSQFLTSLVNARYFEAPLAVLVHGSSGIAFFLTVPLQFSPAFRHKHLQGHRISGRIALLSAYIMAASGVWMHLVLTPEERGMRFTGLVIVSLSMVVAFTIAFGHVLKRQIAAHRRWMYRAVAISLAVVTPLFVETVAALTLGQVETLRPLLVQLLHDYDRLIGLTINLLIAEWLIRSNRL